MPRLIYTFGPDGAGKSTLAARLRETLPGAILIEGTHPERWPDTSWYDQPANREALRQPDIKGCSELTVACFSLINHLAQSGKTENVILDSDPRLQVAGKFSTILGTLPSESVYGMMDEAAKSQLIDSIDQKGLHVTVDGETLRERAGVLIGRIMRRGNPSPFDPKTIEEAEPLVATFDNLSDLLQQQGESITRIDTGLPFSTVEIAI
jgi:hypothetical protein